MKGLMNVPHHKASILANTYIKVYPKKIKIYHFNTERAVVEHGFEPSTKVEKQRFKKVGSNPDETIDLMRSVRRTRTTIQDIVECNEFKYFATFTFKNQRQDVELCKRKMSDWFRDQRKKGNELDYLVVPEFHKDGKSIHFHAVINGNLNLTPTNIFQKGRRIYNISDYKKGFTTVVKIDHVGKVASYIRKYVTKDMPALKGKKRYWVSTRLERPQIYQHDLWTQNPFMDLSPVFETSDLAVYDIPTTMDVLLNQEVIKWQTKKQLNQLKTNIQNSLIKQSSLLELVKNQENPT